MNWCLTDGGPQSIGLMVKIDWMSGGNGRGGGGGENAGRVRGTAMGGGGGKGRGKGQEKGEGIPGLSADGAWGSVPNINSGIYMYQGLDIVLRLLYV